MRNIFQPLFILICLISGCVLQQQKALSASTPDELFKSCLYLLENDKFEEVIAFSIAPSTKVKRPGKYQEAINGMTVQRKQELISEMKIMMNSTPIKYTVNESAVYQISEYHTTKIIFLDNRWYFEQ